jgi:azurin
MKMLSLVCALALAAATAAAQTAKPAPPAKPAAGVRTITITGTENMKYDVTRIQAKPGERLRVVLKAVGAMPKVVMAHNFVLLKLGTDAAAFSTAAANARDTDFIPADKKASVVAATKLAGGGETVEVTFTVPAKAGTYPYICSFPGHFQVGMKGDLVVK